MQNTIIFHSGIVCFKKINNLIAHYLKRTKRASPIEKAEKWIVAQKDQPGLDALFINDSIGKFLFGNFICVQISAHVPPTICHFCTCCYLTHLSSFWHLLKPNHACFSSQALVKHPFRVSRVSGKIISSHKTEWVWLLQGKFHYIKKSRTKD